MANFEYKGYGVHYIENFFDVGNRILNSSNSSTEVVVSRKNNRWLITFKLPEDIVDLIKIRNSGFDASSKSLIDSMILIIKGLIDKGIEHNYFQQYELTNRGFEPEA